MGLIVENVTGQSMVSYVRGNVLTPEMWVPSTELFQSRTFRNWQNPREPLYAGEGIVSSVFDGVGLVYKPYGGFDMEARIGQGGYCCSAPTILEFLQRYHCDSNSGMLIGTPITPSNPVSFEESHGGAQPGVNTLMVQRPGGVNVFIAFNEDDHDEGEHYARDFYTGMLDTELS